VVPRRSRVSGRKIHSRGFELADELGMKEQKNGSEGLSASSRPLGCSKMKSRLGSGNVILASIQYSSLREHFWCNTKVLIQGINNIPLHHLTR
jgi:hypothetical protein